MTDYLITLYAIIGTITACLLVALGAVLVDLAEEMRK